MQNTIIGLGASSMQGVGDTQGGWFARAERLAQDRKMRWINRGIGGNTTRDMLLRVTTVTVHSPHRLVVMLGCNDLPRKYDTQPDRRTLIEEYRNNLNALFPRIQGTQSLFITSFPVCTTRVTIGDEMFETYMAAAKKCAIDAGYEIWDLYEELRGKCEPYWATDGLHFNDAGHALIAQAFVERFL